jgi:hypothetical protein
MEKTQRFSQAQLLAEVDENAKRKVCPVKSMSLDSTSTSVFLSLDRMSSTTPGMGGTIDFAESSMEQKFGAVRPARTRCHV